MATTTNVTSSYSGEHQAKLASIAVLSGNTLGNGLIEIMPNVKYKGVINRIDVDDVVRDSTCDFDPSGSDTLTERIIEPKEMQVNMELCKKNYHDTWFAMEMGMSANDNMPKTFQDYLVGLISAKVAAKIETNIWSGVRANNGEFDGFQTLLAVDADLPAANEVTGTTVTAANVITELGKVVNALPAPIYSNEDLYIYVSQKIWKLYKRALGGFGTSGLGANGVNGLGNNQDFQTLEFDGVKIARANGLGADVMIATLKDNLFFGTGLMADQTAVEIIDMASIGSQNVRIIMRFTGAVQYDVVEDIVTYGITNSAN